MLSANEPQLAKVKDFYQGKLNEISQRTDGLLESVDASVGQQKKYHHRRSRRLESWITKKLGSMIHGDRLRPVRKRSSIPDIEKVFSESDDDPLEKERKEVERVKKSDSIKRAIADIYRTAKLLHNFSILVSPCIHRNLEFVSYLQCHPSCSLLGRIIQDFPRSQRSGTENFPSIKAGSKENFAAKGCSSVCSLQKWCVVSSHLVNCILYHSPHKFMIDCLCINRKICIRHGSAKATFSRPRPRCFPKGTTFRLEMLSIKPKRNKTHVHLIFYIGNRGDGLLMDWIQLRLGYRLGMCTILALWVAWDCVWGVVEKGQVSIARRTAFPVFRGCFGLVAWHWFWGMSVYVWTRYRINYIYLFEFDPRNVDTPIGIFNEAADELLVFLICMLLYDKVNNTKFFFDHGKIIHLSRFCFVMLHHLSTRRMLVICPCGYHPMHIPLSSSCTPSNAYFFLGEGERRSGSPSNKLSSHPLYRLHSSQSMLEMCSPVW